MITGVRTLNCDINDFMLKLTHILSFLYDFSFDFMLFLCHLRETCPKIFKELYVTKSDGLSPDYSKIFPSKILKQKKNIFYDILFSYDYLVPIL